MNLEYIKEESYIWKWVTVEEMERVCIGILV